uniref:Transcription elongation factor A (SII), 3 n=1 Tax=Neogobius melanostomus TaxID=47308 RepID=A0A8C6SSL9_9GOBI
MTREEELIRIAKKLDKMVSRNNTEGALDLLKELKSFNMTLKLLQETRIGMSVNGIRKHCSDEEVIALAKFLIKDWKRLLGNTILRRCLCCLVMINGYFILMTDSGSNGKTSENKNGLEKEPPDPNAPLPPLPLHLHPPPPPKRPSVDGKKERSGQSSKSTSLKPHDPTSPLSPGFGTSGGPLSSQFYTGVSVRDKCIEMIAAALRFDNDYKEFDVNIDSMAAEIEDHILLLTATDMKYKNRVNVLARSIELSRIATMTSEEMASDELKQLRNVLTQEAIREHQMAKTSGTSTDMLQCSKCRKKNCTYNQVQTRSADEPMTTFVLCNECGNRWKFC